MAKPSTELTAMVLQMAAVVRVLVGERRHDEAVLLAAEENARQFEDRCSLLG